VGNEEFIVSCCYVSTPNSCLFQKLNHLDTSIFTCYKTILWPGRLVYCHKKVNHHKWIFCVTLHTFFGQQRHTHDILLLLYISPRSISIFLNNTFTLLHALLSVAMLLYSLLLKARTQNLFTTNYLYQI